MSDGVCVYELCVLFCLCLISSTVYCRHTCIPTQLVAHAEGKLRPVMVELAYNLESFNPAFTAVLLKVRQKRYVVSASCRFDLTPCMDAPSGTAHGAVHKGEKVHINFKDQADRNDFGCCNYAFKPQS